MRRRRFNSYKKWKPLTPWMESIRMRPGLPVLLAPVIQVSDIIDICAGYEQFTRMHNAPNLLMATNKIMHSTMYSYTACNTPLLRFTNYSLLHMLTRCAFSTRASCNYVVKSASTASRVKFINYTSGSLCGDSPISRLIAHRVFTSREEGKWKAVTFIAFSSKSGTLPSLLDGLKVYSIFGSEYTFTVCKELPPEQNNVVDVTMGGLAGEAEALNRALAAASKLINDNIDPVSEIFKDAVLSRYNFFVKQRLTAPKRILERPPLPSESPSTRPLPQWDPLFPQRSHSPLDKRLETECFQKPEFKSIDELMFAFSTHTIDSFTGLGRPLSPLEPTTEFFKYQSLVFYSPQSTAIQSVEID